VFTIRQGMWGLHDVDEPRRHLRPLNRSYPASSPDALRTNQAICDLLVVPLPFPFVRGYFYMHSDSTAISPWSSCPCDKYTHRHLGQGWTRIFLANGASRNRTSTGKVG
jgi:hypothetical protein